MRPLALWGMLAGVFASAAERDRTATGPTGPAAPVVLKLHWYPQRSSPATWWLRTRSSSALRAWATWKSAGRLPASVAWTASPARRCLLHGLALRRPREARPRAPVVHLAQVAQRSAMLLVARRASGIIAPADMTGSAWGCGAATSTYCPAPSFENSMSTRRSCRKATAWSHFCEAVTIASAMHYNEYHKLLEAGLRPEELVVFTLADYGLDFPEDGLYCHERCWARTPRSVHCLGAGRRARLGLRPRTRPRPWTW